MDRDRISTTDITAAALTSFWLAQAISLFGDRLNNFSLVALISTYSQDPSMTLAALYLSMFLPLFILAPMIGLVVDRLDKRWILIITDIVRAGLVFLIPFVYSTGDNFLGIFIIVFILSTGNLFFLPAKSALIPEIVPSEKLVRVNSILWTAGIIGMVAGFLGGGIIFDRLSWRHCFYLDAGTYLASSALLVILLFQRSREIHDVEPGVDKSEKNIFMLIASAASELKTRIELLKPMIVQILIFVGAGGASVLVVPLIKEVTPQGSSLGLSYTGIAVGAGMGTGSYLANKIKGMEESKAAAEMVFFILLLPSVAVMALIHSLPGLIVGGYFSGLLSAPLIILSETKLQRESRRSLRGRIFSFREILTKSFFLISAFILSYLNKFIDKRMLLIALGLFLASAGTIWIALSEAKSREKKHSGG